MPKRLLKRYMPDEKTIRDHKHLQFFGKLLHNPNLWHLNRRSVAGAFSVGLFTAMLPMPFQMIIAAAAAIPLRVNLPISVGLVWLSNPLTMAPLFYASYTTGAWALQTPALPLEMEFTWEWLSSQSSLIWQPFLLGSLIVGALAAVVGNLLIRLLWRFHVMKNREKRRQRQNSK
ncbi:MAG: hypothetical protein FD130_1253 [Halothiobacillaceae bacterium]|nr:MAG: hypothetical protein FD130_1253 [Halothiobacillaceae bacterium]